ncbi:MAG TPA: PAS domain S-box protein [Candidatus Galloscillospira stercoripullorum]|nr:PAS domain S-box protein [Candidatus Galloscillospira stercoripullorum]
MKKRLIGATLVTVIVALLVSGAIQIFHLHQQEEEAARESLRELLILMDAQSAITDPEGVTEQFTQAAPEKRLTIIDVDGSVVADTQADPSTMENHSDRSEVTEARLTGWGEATRPSDTVGQTMLYVAKRFADGMVGLASMPVSSVDALVWGNVLSFVIAAAVALLLALILSGRMARSVLRPLHAVGEALQEALDGKPTDALERYQGDDEVRPILRYIDKLVERLGRQIEEIRTERDKVSLILDCMDEGLILLDREGNILASNRSARKLFGVREGEEGGSILLLTRSRRVRDAIEQVKKSQTAQVLDLEDESLAPGSLRMFLSPVSGRQYEGTPVGVSILISDVTALKRAEGIRSQFTANVSHELKTPLTSIKGFTDMLCSGMVHDKEDQQRFLTMIGVEVDRLIELINDILRLSELESATIQQGEERCDVLQTAQETAELLAPAAQTADVTVSVSGESGVAAISPSRLKELLVNLMENAVKYTERGGKVDVTVTPVPGQVTFTVADTGIGIPEEDRERVFERFYRVDKGRCRKSGGTGLGLAIVKHIVQLYDGTISLESQVGKGSTFTVTLPAAAEEN